MTKAKRISRLKKKCDKAWSDAVRARDGVCQICGTSKNLQAHHWWAQKARSLALRWDLRNGVTVCYRDHIFSIHQYAVYSTLGPLFDKLKSRVGALGLFEMDEASRKVWKDDEEILEGILADLKAGRKVSDS